MTYQSTITPSASHGVVSRAVHGTATFFRAIGHALIEGSSGHRRFEQVKALQSKTDAELAALKIKREDIVHHVFKDLYYI